MMTSSFSTEEPCGKRRRGGGKGRSEKKEEVVQVGDQGERGGSHHEVLIGEASSFRVTSFQSRRSNYGLRNPRGMVDQNLQLV